MLFSALRSTLLLLDNQKDAKAELLELKNYDESTSTPLEKPKRGILLREKSQYFRFSREDSASVLISDFESGISGRNDWGSSTPTPDIEYTHEADPEYPVISLSQQKNLQRKFDKSKQLRQLLLKGFLKWVVTCFLIAMIIVSLNHFSEKHVMSDGKKREFNTVITGLSLALGFNLAGSFKAMAIDMRWWILSRKRRSLREVDLILNSDSMMNIMKLMWIAPRPKIIIASILWLALNLGAQAGVAMLGLTYSIDSGTTYALTARGNVSSPDMRFFYPEDHNMASSDPSESSQAYTANIYGNVALSYKSKDISQLPSSGITWEPDTADYFEGDDFWEFVFLDSNPGTGSSAISMYTDRTITASGLCSCLTVSNLTELNDPGITSLVNLTTYTIERNCGPRCAEITALEIVSLTEAWLYNCNISIGIPGNATVGSSEYVPDDMAIIAAQSIALQPYYTPQMYPAEATYGTPQKGNSSTMAKLISRFAIGSIISAAYNNPTSFKVGNQPQEGVVLNIDKPAFLILILFLTAGVQGILFILSAIFANRVVVRDDSHLATARLLRPLMERLGRSGNNADGKDISEALGADVPGSHGKHLEVIYSVKHAQEGVLHHLDLGEQRALRKGFPEGIYD